MSNAEIAGALFVSEATVKTHVGRVLTKTGARDRVQVVVLGYPRFYKLSGSCIVGLSEAERAAINSGADLLNSVTAKRAADHGFSFGDVTTTFTGHEICSGSAWLNSVTIPIDESYHPTAAGQSGGYLPVFGSAA